MGAKYSTQATSGYNSSAAFTGSGAKGIAGTSISYII